MLLLNILMAVFLASCGQLQTLKDTEIYRHDMHLKVNNRAGVGVLVASDWSNYKIHAKAAGDLDLFTYSTCHREEYAEEAWNKGWFASKSEVGFEYTPNVQVEKVDCAMQLGGYEKIDGKHSWGFIDFEDKEYRLGFKMNCNGDVLQFNGVGLCQSRKELRQEIYFFDDVFSVGQEECPQLSKISDRHFIVNLGRGFCRYTFKLKNGDLKARVTTIGYDQIPLRKK